MADAQLALDFDAPQEPTKLSRAQISRRHRQKLKARDGSEIVPPTEKRCGSCSLMKPAAAFARNRTIKDGLAAVCRECKATQHQRRRQKGLDNPPEVASKVCPGCGIDKPASEFHKQTAAKDGLAYYCRACAAPRMKAAYEADKENRIRQAWLNQKKDPSAARIHKLVARHNQRVKEVGAEGRFDSSEWRAQLEYFDGHCAYCGAHESECGPLVMEHMLALSRGGSGWIENVVPACSSCNGSKHDKNILEYLLWQQEVKTLLYT